MTNIVTSRAIKAVSHSPVINQIQKEVSLFKQKAMSFFEPTNIDVKSDNNKVSPTMKTFINEVQLVGSGKLKSAYWNVNNDRRFIPGKIMGDVFPEFTSQARDKAIMGKVDSLIKDGVSAITLFEVCESEEILTEHVKSLGWKVESTSYNDSKGSFVFLRCYDPKVRDIVSHERISLTESGNPIRNEDREICFKAAKIERNRKEQPEASKNEEHEILTKAAALGEEQKTDEEKAIYADAAAIKQRISEENEILAQSKAIKKDALGSEFEKSVVLTLWKIIGEDLMVADAASHFNIDNDNKEKQANKATLYVNKKINKFIEDGIVKRENLVAVFGGDVNQFRRGKDRAPGNHDLWLPEVRNSFRAGGFESVFAKKGDHPTFMGFPPDIQPGLSKLENDEINSLVKGYDDAFKNKDTTAMNEISMIYRAKIFELLRSGNIHLLSKVMYDDLFEGNIHLLSKVMYEDVFISPEFSSGKSIDAELVVPEPLKGIPKEEWERLVFEFCYGDLSESEAPDDEKKADDKRSHYQQQFVKSLEKLGVYHDSMMKEKISVLWPSDHFPLVASINLSDEEIQSAILAIQSYTEAIIAKKQQVHNELRQRLIINV